MKALLLAATSSLALTGFAVAQTATDPGSAVPVTGAPTEADSAMTGAGTVAGTDMGTIDNASPAATDGVPMGGAAMDSTTMPATTGTDMTTVPPATTGTMATTDMTTTTMPATTTTDMTTTTMGDATPTMGTTSAMLTPDNPGMLGSWIMNRRVWTTNQPSTTAWQATTLTERPAEWTDIASVDDIVVSPEGGIVGYVADIGGFLGLGAKSVLLSPDVLHFVQIGDDAFFATNYTREELEALPDFDTSTVMR